MTFKWGIAVFVVMVIQPLLTEAAASRSRQCTYTGYAPGGSVPKITSITAKAPEKFEETVLQKTLEIGETGGEVIEKALELSKASPQLAMTFGAIAIALGMAQKEPSPNDILDRAHESIQLLADDVNERLNQLQDYADVKDLQLERRVMNRNYKELFDKWQECLTYQTKKEADACQSRVERTIKSARYQFQPLQSMFDQEGENNKPLYDPNFKFRYVGTWQWMERNKGTFVNYPSYDEVKRLEIGLIPFRNYVTLHLLVLETAIKAQEARGSEGCSDLKFLLNRMVEKSDYYVRYVKWAYEWIYIRQYEENMFFGIPRRAEGRSYSAPAEGFIGTSKCSGRTCTVECSQMMKDNVCTFSNGSPKQVQKETDNICETYLAQVKEQLTKFWKEQILDLAKIWEKYGQQAKDKLASSKC